MKTRFILRFEDFCPTANWPIWDRIEELLGEFGVNPILSVIPDNRDKALLLDRPGENFWDRARSWQRRGWTLGLHGYQHRYLTRKAGLYGRSAMSEFAGLPYEVQEIKLKNAIRIFHEHGIKPELWVAPAHSFDASTIDILLKMGVHIINDGYALYPYKDDRGMIWIPQQMGRFRNVPIGIWTICFHFSCWTNEDLKRFRADLERFRPQIISVSDVLKLCKRRQSWVYAGAARLLDAGLRIGRPLRESFKSTNWQAWSKSFRRTIRQ
jgi:predicted deacetylase